MIPRFVVIDYKIQEALFRTIMLKLHKHSKSKNKSLYKRFCFTYVQLSCLQILDIVWFLQSIILGDIGSKLYPKLWDESLKIDNKSD